MSFYTGHQPGQIPGLLPPPYYWWEAGAFMGAMIDYWYYTGDTTYNTITMQGLLHQVGPNNDYMPPNQTLTEGNDDQGFWGMAVMSAAEYNFPDPPKDQPQWVALAQAVFNTQASRWDTEYCDGGLRWQIFTWNNGFNYKNSISAACFLNIAARLALYTGNSTYADWAVTTWDWMVDVKLMDEDYRIYDGAHTDDNCVAITPYEFSYNVGGFLLGAAAMYEYHNARGQAGQSALWRKRVDGLLDAAETIFFFGDDTSNRVMIEIACEPVNLCDVDQLSFKAYLSRWMAATTKWAPWTFDRVKTLLGNSAAAAVRQCRGGDNGRMCGFRWANNSAGDWDGTTGVGQQMAAMEVVLGNMIREAKAPVTNSTGGTSIGNPGAGNSAPGHGYGSGSGSGRAGDDPWNLPLGGGDRAGAALVTLIVLCGLLMGIVFVLTDEYKSPRENWDDFRSSMSDVASGALARAGGRYTAAEKGKGRADVEKSAPAANGPSRHRPPGTAQQVRQRDVPWYFGGGQDKSSAGPVADDVAVPSDVYSTRKHFLNRLARAKKA
ncbi:hypothetical protein DL765_000705 [Monosporascus sp. GIB2]|nr:hypothetical protein DL765_000705 [Monosporascus sp. GIB2]